jgi:hypothetical protein
VHGAVPRARLEPNPIDAWLFLLRLWVCGQRSCVVHISTGGPCLACSWLAFTGRGEGRLATVPIDHDHPVRRMATTGSTDRRERATCKQPGPVTPGTTLAYEGPRRAHCQADALNAGARHDASLRAPGGAASSRPPKGRGPDGPAHSGMLEGGLVGRTLWRLKRGPQGPDGPLPMEKAGRSRSL